MPTPLPVLPGVYYCHLTGTNAGLPTGNVFTFLASVPPVDAVVDQAWAQEIANDIPLEWSTTVGPAYPNDVAGWDCRVYALGHPVLPAVFGHTTGGGADTGLLAPVSAAGIIRHSVMRRGRGSQSHSAISPLPQGAISDDGRSLTDGFRVALGEEFNNFIEAVIADFSAFTGGAAISYVQLSKLGSGATYPITSSSAETLLGTERSRTPRP